MNPFNTIKGAIITGFVIALVLAALIPPGLDSSTIMPAIARWLHIVSSVMWIGLLYYFNVVQIPGLAVASSDSGGPGGAGISKYIAPRALLWFRWAAVATWLTGAWYLGADFVNVFTLGLLQPEPAPYYMILGIGAWLGTVMLFNVWVFIWPNQKKILGITPATDEEKAKARNVAKYASRTNFILSIPVLMCMGGATHGLPL